jgi:Mitochondrial carrier protein
LSGLFASSFAKCFTHPVDTIKAKLQVLTMPAEIYGSSTDAFEAMKFNKSEGLMK